MLVKNYGLLWHRSDVYWGKQRSPGNLMGLWVEQKREEWIVDFREQSGIYCLYDDLFRLVYVGQAGSGNSKLFSRLHKHTKDHLAQRWSRFSWFGTRAVKEDAVILEDHKDSTGKIHTDTKTVLNQIEAVLISAAEPLLNKQGGRFGGDAEQYIQYRDEKKLQPDLERMIAEIWKKVE